MRTRILEIAGGVRVVVPDSLNLLTPYVLLLSAPPFPAHAERRGWLDSTSLKRPIDASEPFLARFAAEYGGDGHPLSLESLVG